MHSGFEWGRVLIAVLLLGFLFAVPTLVLWRDQRRDLRRFGPGALSRPVRYTPDGKPGREGLPQPFAHGTSVERVTGDEPSEPLPRTDATSQPAVVSEASATGR